MAAHVISRFLRSHFHSGPKSVMMLSESRLIIQAVGLHCSSDGKLPNAYKGRFDVTTFQLALKINHPKVFRQTKMKMKTKNKLIIVLNKFENKVLFNF